MAAPPGPGPRGTALRICRRPPADHGLPPPRPGRRSGHPPVTRVTLREDGRELATQTVALSGSGQQELRFPYRPDRPGAHLLQVSASPLPGEISLLNNTRKVQVRVVE